MEDYLGYPPPSSYEDAVPDYYPTLARNLATGGDGTSGALGGVNATNGTHTGDDHRGHHYLEDSLLAPFALLLIGAILRHSTR